MTAQRANRWVGFMVLVFLLSGCKPAAALNRTPNALPATPSMPAELPSATPTRAAATAPPVTASPTPLPPTQAPPTPLPTQIVVQPPPRLYTCPWADAATTTPVYSYRVLHEYAHDPQAYTQGLIFRDGVFYEGTGLKGQSSLRRVALESGEVQQVIDLPQQYFGEGITELDGQIFQLTWREQTGFIYDLETFEQLDTFFYPTEGWGLTHDGQKLVMSDGSASLYFLDPQTQQALGLVTVSAEKIPVPRLNELEFIEGEVWANVYQTACIARIDPASGQVLGWIDISGILAPQDLPGSEVPNGIAYDPAGKRIFVTGKFWPKLFEIEIIPKQ
jgi:glutamine cyclotransferase